MVQSRACTAADTFNPPSLREYSSTICCRYLPPTRPVRRFPLSLPSAKYLHVWLGCCCMNTLQRSIRLGLALRYVTSAALRCRYDQTRIV